MKKYQILKQKYFININTQLCNPAYIFVFAATEALSPEEKARLEALAEEEKNKALQKKKEAEEKKKKLEELQQQQK